MLGLKATTCSKRIIPADMAKGLETYDLFGQKNHLNTCLNLINSCHRELLVRLESQLIRLFNEHECKLELSPFVIDTINIEQDNLIWLKATNLDSGYAVLAINYTTLYNLAEIFLGGSHSNISRKPEDGKVSDSELRLLTTLFTTHLSTVDALLGLSNKWHVSLVSKPEEKVEHLATSFCFTIKNFQAIMDIWYQSSVVTTRVVKEILPAEQDFLTAKLTYATEKIPTKLSLILAKTRLTLAEISKLRKDDLILLDLPEVVSAYSGKQVIAQGKVVEKSGSLVLHITNIPK